MSGSGSAKKRKQKAKKGKVVRIDPELVRLIESRRIENETVSATLRKLLWDAQHTGKSFFVLPSDLYESLSRARGAAVVKAVRSKKVEKPVVVREVTRE